MHSILALALSVSAAQTVTFDGTQLTITSQLQRQIPAEVDVSIRPGWFYHAKEDSLVKTPQQLFDIYMSSVGRGSTLLLNVPPDRRGLIHERDAESLRQWRKLLDETFATNLAQFASVSASNVRGNDTTYRAGHLLDNDPDTYWAADEGVTTDTLNFIFNDNQRPKYVMLQEAIQFGQRVKSFEVQVLDGDWYTVGTGTTIGYKRILPIEQYGVLELRIIIKESLAAPVLSTVAFY